MKYRFLPYIALVLIAILVVIIINYRGIGITPDSIYYADAASHLVAGRGYQALDFVSGSNLSINHFPPGLSLLLTIGLQLGLSIETTSILLNVISLTLLVITLYSMSIHITAKSIVGFLVCLLTFHPSLLSQYTNLSSEPPFITLVTAGAFALWIHLVGENRSLLVASAVLFGLATIVRYAGLPFLLVGALMLLINRQRVEEIIGFVGIGILPFALWIIYSTYFTTHTDTIRSFDLHIISIATLLNGSRAVGGWFIPTVIPFRTGFAAIIILVILVIVYSVLRKNRHPGLSIFVIFMGSFQVFYVVFLLISISFFDAHTPLSARILSPIYPFALISIIAVFSTLHLRKKYYVLLTGYLLYVIMFSWLWIWQERLDANNFSSQAWVKSPLLAHVRELPMDTIIYSNAADAVYWHTGRIVNFIPYIIDPNTSRVNMNLEQEVETMRIALDNGAYLVYFEQVTWRDYLLTLDDLQPLPSSRVLRD